MASYTINTDKTHVQVSWLLNLVPVPRTHRGMWITTLSVVYSQVNKPLLYSISGYCETLLYTNSPDYINVLSFSWKQRIASVKWYFLLSTKSMTWRWRGGPVVNRTCYSSRGSKLGSQHPHDGLKPSLTPDPEFQGIPFSDFLRHQALTWCTYKHVAKTLI